jgi:polysaccharide deacetylase family protein (PEP-CTERM system associated)
MTRPNSTLSIDWEDFGQLFAKYHHGIATEPAKGAIERQTSIILNLLAETNTVGTFFVLGMLAKCRPELVRTIANAGHEIALHGTAHTAMYTLTPKEARADVADNCHLVEDIIGKKVHGYRAPFFSLVERNLYLLDTLAELGLLYDSSIFPMKLARYGIDGFSTLDTLYELKSGLEIVELPLTVATYGGRKLPVSGGGYIRLLPGAVLRRVFGDLERQGTNTMIYMHPYEFDSEALDVSAGYPSPPEAASSKLRVAGLNFRWNLFRNSVCSKVKALLKQHTFVTCLEKANHVKSQGIRTKLLGRS